MRAYIITPREKQEIEKYMAGGKVNASFMNLILERGREALPQLESDMEILRTLLKTSEEA